MPGVPQWKERNIAQSKQKKRVQGVWGTELVRRTLVLEDDRKLTYFLDGPGDHQLEEEPEDIRKLPHIFVFHGMFLSGNVWLMKTPPKEYVLVCVNRPGYFGSDPPLSKTYNFKDFAHDIEQLANHMKIDKFYVAGHSSGGPCSLACAAHLKDRVLAVGLLSSDPEYAHESAPKKPSVDAFVMERILPSFFFIPSVKGLRNDTRLENNLYSFETESITQPVQIYVGANDTVLPPEWSRQIQQRLPNATLRILPGVGHMEVIQDDVLQQFFPALVALGGNVAAAPAAETPNNTDSGVEKNGKGANAAALPTARIS